VLLSSANRFLPPRERKKENNAYQRYEEEWGGLSSSHARKKSHGKYRVANTRAPTRAETRVPRHSPLDGASRRAARLDRRSRRRDGGTGRIEQDRGGSIRGNPDNDVPSVLHVVPPSGKRVKTRGGIKREIRNLRALRERGARRAIMLWRITHRGT